MFSLVLTHLDYSNAILINSSDSVTKFQLIHNFVAKMVLNKRKWDSPTECIKEFHWLPVMFQHVYELQTIIYNTLIKEGPTCLQAKLSIKHNQRSTRNPAQDKNNFNLITPFNSRKIYVDLGFTFTAAL